MQDVTLWKYHYLQISVTVQNSRVFFSFQSLHALSHKFFRMSKTPCYWLWTAAAVCFGRGKIRPYSHTMAWKRSYTVIKLQCWAIKKKLYYGKLYAPALCKRTVDDVKVMTSPDDSWCHKWTNRCFIIKYASANFATELPILLWDKRNWQTRN